MESFKKASFGDDQEKKIGWINKFYPSFFRSYITIFSDKSSSIQMAGKILTQIIRKNSIYYWNNKDKVLLK